MSKSYQNCKRKLRKLTKRARLAPREVLLDLAGLSDQEKAFTDKRSSEYEKIIRAELELALARFQKQMGQMYYQQTIIIDDPFKNAH